MIIGMSVDQEICLMIGQVSLDLLYWKKNLQTDIRDPGEDSRGNSWHPGKIIHDQKTGKQLEETSS